MADPPSMTPPGAAVDDAGDLYIGVANDYAGPGRASVNDRSAMEAEARGVYRQRGGVTPTFKKGMERTWVAGLPPEQVAAVQRAMVEAGLLTGTTFRYGVWDDTSATAFRQVLSYANSEGLTDPGRALSEMTQRAAQFPQPQTETQGRAPQVTQLTDPADLKRAFRATSQSLMGRVDEDFVNQMVSTYQQREASTQTQAYGMGETGGTYTAPPSPTAYAEEQTRQQYGTEVGAAQIASTYNDFLGILKGGLGTDG